MKKILGFLFAIVILGCGGYFVYVNYIKSKVPKLNLEEEVSNASKYYVYGNHFNIEGNIDIKDKYYVGYFKNEKLIAVLDLIDGYPKKDIVFIGFLMIDISIQKNGVGSAIVNELIDYLTTLKYKEVRLGWINGNLQAEHFWIKNGFCSIKEGRVVLANRLLNKFFTD